MLTSRSSILHKLLDTFLTKWLVEKSFKILALTERERQALIMWDSKIESLIEIVGNPTQITNETSGNVSIDSVLFAARLHPRKRVEDFVQAAKISNDSGVGVEYKILGPDEGDLAIVHASAPDIPNLKYLGSTNSVGVLNELSQSKVFALVSDEEPWGNVLISALAMGKPVVITASSHLSSVVGEAKAGIVVPDRDPAAIAEAVSQLMIPSIYNDFSENALELHKAFFSNSRVKNNLLNLYVEAISNSKSLNSRRRIR
jgi:glycosyltransferase involved in cell wall biosynthesis